MARSTSDTRERFLDAGTQLFRRQGYYGTGLKEIVSEGKAPWGSLYHFFPEGKEQLGVEALRRAGARGEKLVSLVFESHDSPAEAVSAFCGLVVDGLEKSDFADGCPVATVALEAANRSEPLRRTCAEVFESWERLTATKLVEGGVPPRAADDLASVLLALLEGAVLLSRAQHDSAPLRAAADHAAQLVDAAATPRRASHGARASRTRRRHT